MTAKKWLLLSLVRCKALNIYPFNCFQGRDYEEFVKAASADNEIQFVEVSNVEVASVLFPHVKPTKNFVGIVKSEPERFTAYGELVNWLISIILEFLVFL